MDFEEWFKKSHTTDRWEEEKERSPENKDHMEAVYALVKEIASLAWKAGYMEGYHNHLTS